ncbi:SDR family NAD(P)-dependent oxidoreductase [Streptomyces coeruleorubidus]|uniref:SDR family NAD(P)-dependent oxidoreductase n=1 Tax=Streptomyces coeruleorubidus TaxID=116188 RepID=UPI003CD03A12
MAAELGGRTRFTRLDVTVEEDWRRALTETEQALGPVSVLVNNAGIIDWSTMEQQSPASFRRVLDVNLTCAWLGMRHGPAHPPVRRARGGRPHGALHRHRRHLLDGQRVRHGRRHPCRPAGWPPPPPGD